MNSPNSSKKIRLLLIIDFIYGITGGTENQLCKIINNLPKCNYEIHLLVLRNTEWIIDNKKGLDCHLKTYNIRKLKNPITLIQFYSIYQYIKNIKPDIAMTFFPLSNIVGIIIAALAKVKVLISTRRDYGLWLGNKVALYLLRLANRYVTKIISNSQRVGLLTCKEEKCDPSKIHVIYNGITIDEKNKNAQDTKPPIQKNGPIVGIVGGLKPMKRHSTFIKAAKNVLVTRSDVKFIIVGDGPCKHQLVALTSELNLGDHIYFVGSQDNVKPYLSLFDIGINCSSNEGLSNAIMEYMAYGVPCIVSKAGGNEELIENGINGYTFELDNDRELADLIIKVLNDNKLQGAFASRSKEIALKHLSLNKMIKEYDTHFHQLLTCNNILDK